MSYITHVIVQGADQQQIDGLNEWLRENDERQQELRPINMDAAGGTKYYVIDVWAAAFNYMPLGLREKLLDPETWGVRKYLVSVILDGEESTEVFAPNSNQDTRAE